MYLKHASRSLSAGLIARLSCLKVATAVLTAVVVALVIAQAVVAQDSSCNSYPNGNSYSSFVPCQNATCAYWSQAGLSGTVPDCLDPSGLTITKVTVSITKTAWTRCTSSSSQSACNESLQSCANYWLYGDDGCTVQCKTASSLPQYCKGP